MKESFKNERGKIIVEDMIKIIQDNKNYLSEIDAQLGDGDHGINMNKGFSICYDRIKDKQLGFSESLEVLGNVLLNEIGGSMGPLYGLFFLEMAEVIKSKEEIDKFDFSNMLHRALEGIKQLTDAKIGDKTLLDTLIPSIEAFDRAINNNGSFIEALNDLIESAEKGKDSTRDLISKYGRGSRLGEASRNILDAGAVSCYFILKSMSNSIKKLLESSSYS
ncbi:dihydroxyacetone kinase subunit DhaL [Petrotoga sp. 9PWA.NaAc.5.4]|uniref:dihydroxyacetone kinase subunit DhaL n=1 Tax=Petrotoga sp. 9PWA.NaAc.5.4 TaxID=1434328 RepID=UPI000CBEA214|nr:dihydroxyacetone kinase subunit DhaL [Petrotoga sp. 9PWA.NaAc.5.4]PNR95797.1 dihydroxyacetone kinase [Petrotoga sp. 9PWA.NaAc.5.4]